VTSKTKQGFTLIEVLIAFFVLAFGLLAIIVVQLNMLRATFNARMLQHATLLASDLSERMRANAKNAKNYEGCPKEVARGEGNWCQAVQNALYMGEAKVTAGKPQNLDENGCLSGSDTTDPSDHTIELRWSPLPFMLQDQQDTPEGSRPKQCFVYAFNVGKL
jgi:prepilin-type N-terminal cleavage/methylation domain-containing protein